MSGAANTMTSKAIPHEPTAFLMSTLPAITRSKPLPRKPPIIGTELLIAYFAALKDNPSYVADVIPCTVRKTVNAASVIPSVHLIIPAKNAEKFFTLISLLMLPTIFKTKMSPASGKIADVIIPTTASLKKSTAGWYTATETLPPLVAISVSNTGKIACI